MTDRRAACPRRGALPRMGAPVVVALALTAAACGHPEQKVVDQYFGALNAKDNQTLSAFAVVNFDTKDERVEKWTITADPPEAREPAPLVELVKKQKAVEADAAAQTKTWNAYKLEHYPDLEKVRERLKANAKMPPNLAGVAAEYDKFNQRDRELKKALAEAKDALEKEKRIVAISVGTSDDLESLTGDMVSKTLDVALTMGGETKDYVMVLRKYEMTAGTRRPMNRWVIYELKPKA